MALPARELSRREFLKAYFISQSTVLAPQDLGFERAQSRQVGRNSAHRQAKPDLSQPSALHPILLLPLFP